MRLRQTKSTYIEHRDCKKINDYSDYVFTGGGWVIMCEAALQRNCKHKCVT